MTIRTKKNSLQKRLRELEKESSTLRHEIKSLSRNLKHRESHGAGAVISHDPVTTAAADELAPVTEEVASTPDVKDDLFDQPAPKSTPKRASMLQPLSSKKPKHVVHNAKLGTYLSAGSFAGPKPLRQETRVLRNRALFMVAAVIVMAFIVLQIIL